MSLSGRKAILKVGEELHDETIITFRREEDKTYTKVTKIISRDWKTGGVKLRKRIKPLEVGPFELTQDSEDYDEKIEYEDINGSTKYMYLKLIVAAKFKRYVEFDEEDED